MKAIKKFLLASILSIFGLANLSMFNTVCAGNMDVYGNVIWQTTNGTSLKTAVHWDVVTDEKWATLVNVQVLKIVGYIIDIFIVVWILVAFLGWYKIMTSDKEETMKEWVRLVIFGIIWIIIMVSARFLASWLEGLLKTEFVGASSDSPKWMRFVASLYEDLLYPFIKLALYFVIWILFFMMVWKIVSFVTATDDSVKKKAGWVIIRSVVWILIVMWAKQLVESVMWKQEQVLCKNKECSWIDEQRPDSILDFGSIPIVTQVINWVMWLTMLAILVLILIQWYKMFTKPDDPKTRESLKKTLIYIIIWVLVIWAAYAISSVLVINNVPIETAASTA